MFLCFFPALFPLSSLIPWVLGLVGILAGGIQALRHRPRKALVVASLGLALAAGVAGIDFFQKKAEQTQLPPSLPLENLPAQITTRAWHQLLPRAPLSNLAHSEKHQLLIYG